MILVHGDLRDARIIICKGGSVMLVNFDWDGEVSYLSANLNNELLQGRVSTDPVIRKADDRWVLTQWTLALLMNVCHDVEGKDIL